MRTHKALYLIPFATLALCLAVAQCNDSPLFAAVDSYSIVWEYAGESYVADYGLTIDDCERFALPVGARCVKEN